MQSDPQPVSYRRDETLNTKHPLGDAEHRTTPFLIYAGSV